MLRLAARRGVAAAAVRRRGLAAASEALDSDTVGAPSPNGAPSARVASLADDLVSLNMLEVKELTDTLKERLGIDDAALMGGGPAMSPAMMAAMAGAGAPGAAAPAEEAAPEKTSFDLKLESFDAGKKISVIKEIRSITELGLKEAKALVDEAPKVFKTAVAKEEAEEIAHRLKELGAVVALE